MHISDLSKYIKIFFFYFKRKLSLYPYKKEEEKESHNCWAVAGFSCRGVLVPEAGRV